jgi:thioredoxin-related protein
VIVHREEVAAWIDQFDVRIYPTTLLIGRDGRVLDRLEGFVAPTEFLGRLQRNQLPAISSLW